MGAAWDPEHEIELAESACGTAQQAVSKPTVRLC